MFLQVFLHESRLLAFAWNVFVLLRLNKTYEICMMARSPFLYGVYMTDFIF